MKKIWKNVVDLRFPRSRKDEKQFEEQNEETVLAPSIARSPKNSPKKLESPKSKKNGGENCCQIGDDDDLRETQSMGENGRGIDDDWSKNPPHKVTSETEIDDYSEAATKKMNK
ncbi:unnamed protein product [Caenorhabditis angaria]|uniref:Uncharacterized protein n=1 Tax=Caenorhabditis angaria TaxID=860376 RepID=A0A9P1MT36_9PELO|nr:unnamed protein product [Caenorhabditis angaria]